VNKNRAFVSPAIIILLTVILYGNTLSHDYALDDSIVITENQFTIKGIKGIREIFINDSFTGFFSTKKELVQGGRYRPLSIATFAVEYHFFGEKPSVSHLINILLYAMTGIMIWLILVITLEDFPDTLFRVVLPLFTALLFIFHPIHTEVVANIKGRDEILAMLFSLIAMYLAFKYANQPKIHRAVLLSLCFFLALLSKENSITFLLLIPVALVVFKNPGLRKVAFVTVFLSITVLIYLIIRTDIIGAFKSAVPAELMNNPFLHVSNGQKYATIIYTLGIYLRLLIFPHPLTFDYYPYHVEIQEWNLLIGIILFVYLALLFLSAFLITRNIRQRTTASIPAFAVTYYLVTVFLVSNIPFNMGTFMNERFIYSSSLAFCIILGWLIISLSKKFKRGNYFRTGCLLLVLALYGYKAIDRNKAWKDNYTLFTTDVKTSANSAKSNCSAGGVIYEASLSVNDSVNRKLMLNQAAAYLKRAVEIHDRYVDAWQLLGNVCYEEGNYGQALDYYLKALEINPNDTTTLNNAEIVISRFDNADKKILACERLLQINPGSYSINYMLGNLYGKHKNNLPAAIAYLTRAYHINPQSFEVCKDLGVARGMSGEYNQSIEWFNKALMLDPEDAETYINMGITYYHLGDRQKANQYFKKGEELKQGN
jgi:tetratricopeptide (TPR) repeat protein